MSLFSKIKKYSWILVAMPLVFTSCSEDIMDGINEDVNHSTDAAAKFILADVITKTAVSNASGDLNTYASIYVEHETGVHNQMYNAEHREGEPTSSSTYNNSWGSIYTALTNARLIITKCSEGGSQPNNHVTRGMAEVLAAYNLALLTDLYGDAPWKESGSISILTPKIDKQEEIYEDVMAYLDAAIVDLQKTDAQAAGAYDLLYGGNQDKWLKFAYGLKARYTMRLIHRANDKAAAYNDVIKYADLSFSSAADQAGYNVYNATNLNPFFDFQWSRDGLGASRSMGKKLLALNDPRARRVFIDADWVQVADPSTAADMALLGENGATEQVQYKYHTSMFTYSQTASTLLLSFHEVLFLKAEAMARLGQDANTVAPVLKNAVVAAIANTELSITAALNAPAVLRYGGLEEVTSAISPAEAATYFDNEVLPRLTSNTLQEVMVQKYLGFFGASGEATETYNDIRRMKALGENFVQLENTKNFPLRFTYGNDDTTTNPYVKEAYGNGQYVYTENVWWAGGTR